jgi:hypothetical protein
MSDFLKYLGTKYSNIQSNSMKFQFLFEKCYRNQIQFPVGASMKFVITSKHHKMPQTECYSNQQFLLFIVLLIKHADNISIFSFSNHKNYPIIYIHIFTSRQST